MGYKSSDMKSVSSSNRTTGWSLRTSTAPFRCLSSKNLDNEGMKATREISEVYRRLMFPNVEKVECQINAIALIPSPEDDVQK